MPRHIKANISIFRSLTRHCLESGEVRAGFFEAKAMQFLYAAIIAIIVLIVLAVIMAYFVGVPDWASGWLGWLTPGERLPKWVFVPHMASEGGDHYNIHQMKGYNVDPASMQIFAGRDPAIKAYTTSGWFKHTVAPKDQWRRWTEDPKQGMFVREDVFNSLSGEVQTAPKWVFVRGKASPGGDHYNIHDLKGYHVDPASMQIFAERDPAIKAYTTSGWFKHTVAPKNQWIIWTKDPNQGMFVRGNVYNSL